MELRVTGTDDEALLLDLLNTTPVIDGVPTDDLADPHDADAWLAARGLALEPAERDTLIEVRAALQAVVRDGASPELLAPFLSGVDLRPLVDDSGVTWQVSGADTAARMALAWDGLRISHPGRLRPCANTACHLFLLDRSRPNNARWCSMAVCGNRMKARRHYQRTRG